MRVLQVEAGYGMWTILFASLATVITCTVSLILTDPMHHVAALSDLLQWR